MRLWDRAQLLDRQSRLRAWLITVAYNAALDRRRRKSLSTIPLVEALDHASATPGPEDEAIMTEGNERFALRFARCRTNSAT